MRHGRSIIAMLLGTAVLCACSGNDDNTVLADLIDKVAPPTPTQVAVNLFDPYDADKRRKAVDLISASPFGGEEPYVKSYRLLLGRTSSGEAIAPDSDPTVRAAAVAALGRHGDVDDALLIVTFLNDQNAFVRWQSAKSLQKIHDPAVVVPLMDAMARDEDADVRQAAAGALGQYPQPRVFDALVGTLSDVNFGVVEAARSALRQLTGQDLAQDPGAWLAWADDHRNDLFAQQRRYGYLPYQKPPSWWQRAQFWTDPPRAQPLAPVGLSAPSSPPAS